MTSDELLDRISETIDSRLSVTSIDSQLSRPFDARRAAAAVIGSYVVHRNGAAVDAAMRSQILSVVREGMALSSASENELATSLSRHATRSAQSDSQLAALD